MSALALNDNRPDVYRSKRSEITRFRTLLLSNEDNVRISAASWVALRRITERTVTGDGMDRNGTSVKPVSSASQAKLSAFLPRRLTRRSTPVCQPVARERTSLGFPSERRPSTPPSPIPPDAPCGLARRLVSRDPGDKYLSQLRTSRLENTSVLLLHEVRPLPKTNPAAILCRPLSRIRSADCSESRTNKEFPVVP